VLNFLFFFFIFFLFDTCFFRLFFVLTLSQLLFFSWTGFLLFCEGFFNWIIVYLSLMIFILIFLVEASVLLIILRGLLCLVSVFFFFVVRFFFFYIFFELSLIPIVLMVLGYGIQIEKMRSLNYLVFYSMLSTFPFLYAYLRLEVGLYVVYLDFIVSEEFLLFFVLGFIIKFPIYFFHY
jgi:NADH-ubiquinone oxidoreductase chain 4